MAFTCEYCGAKSNEIKGGGEISPNGRRVILTAQSPADLARELYKSETCTVEIPELELELAAGTIGSTFTIVEGLVTQIRDSLARTHFMVAGDSAEVPEEAIRFRQLLDQLDACAKGNMFPYTIILDDPLANCFIYGQEEDPNLVFETYERTEEQNIDFGISDMNTENYVET